jgi:PAS domain S-box-containing protein
MMDNNIAKLRLLTELERYQGNMSCPEEIEGIDWESVNNMELFFNIVPDMLCIASLEDGHFKKLNPSWEQTLGYSTDELLSRPFIDFVHPDDRIRTLLEVERQLKGQPVINFVNRYKCQNGEYKWLSWIASPPMNNALLYASARDISEIKSLEHKLDEANQRFIKILDGIDALIYVADMNTYELLFVNQYGRNIWGDIAPGKICWQTLQNEQGGPCEFCTNKYLLDASGASAGVYTWEFQNTVNGRWYYINDRAISWMDGRMVRLEIASDITARKDAEMQLHEHREKLSQMVEERTCELKKSNELLHKEISERKWAEAETRRATQLASVGELAAGVAHEINNPINGIINYAQLLLNKNNGGNDGKEIAGRIIKEGDRIANIVSNLLSFARELGDNKTVASMYGVIFDTLDLTRTQINKDGIKLALHIPDNLPSIFAYPQQIQQVFLNIVTNARYALNSRYKGSHKDKILEISAKEITEEGASYVQIVFYDRGTGITSDLMDKIMNPFFTTKPSGLGTGLGLSISHGIISSHGGTMTIESVEGEFTKVKICLPAKSGP